MIDRGLVDMLRSAMRHLAAGEVDEARGLVDLATTRAERSRVCLHVRTEDPARELHKQHTQIFEVVLDDDFAELYEPLVQGRMERDTSAVVLVPSPKCPVRFFVEVAS